jgi:hypothetical protein
MRLQLARYLAFGFGVLSLLSACGPQGEGAACSVEGHDCQSPLTCVPIAGYVNVGKCCTPNTQCGSAQSGFTLNQDGGAETADGPIETPNDAIGPDAGSDADVVTSDVEGG